MFFFPVYLQAQLSQQQGILKIEMFTLPLCFHDTWSTLGIMGLKKNEKQIVPGIITWGKAFKGGCDQNLGNAWFWLTLTVILVAPSH
jgi:hypothetical protein